jgi:DNA-binding beta-propeller fold protein YncE
LSPSVKLTAMVWTTVCGLLASAAVAAAAPASAAPDAPLKLAHSYALPADIKGHFDHFGVDAQGKRLFGTAVEDRKVVVFDFGRGKLVKEIAGVHEPRAVLYRSDLSKLYVSDGGGAMRVFDSNTFAPLKRFSISVDADPIVYDPATHRLFVVNGGEKAHHEYTSVTVFDTTALTQVGEVRLLGIEIEGMTVESAGPRVFANNRDKNQVDIFDRNDFHKIGIWPLSRVKRNTVSALDEAGHRLFVAGHEGQLGIIDSDSGKELQILDVGPGSDDISYDAASRRIYVCGGGGSGSVDVFEQTDADRYRSLGRITTQPGAATGRLVAETGEYLVMAPAHAGKPAQVLVYAVVPAP